MQVGDCANTQYTISLCPVHTLLALTGVEAKQLLALAKHWLDSSGSVFCNDLCNFVRAATNAGVRSFHIAMNRQSLGHGVWWMCKRISRCCKHLLPSFCGSQQLRGHDARGPARRLCPSQFAFACLWSHSSQSCLHTHTTQQSCDRKRCHVCFAGQLLLCYVTELGDACCNMTANHCHSSSPCLYKQHDDVGHGAM